MKRRRHHSKTAGMAEFIGGGIDAAVSWAARMAGGKRRTKARKMVHVGPYHNRSGRRISAFNKRVSALMRKHPGMSLGQASRMASKG